jgi:hypothetical protein
MISSEHKDAVASKEVPPRTVLWALGQHMHAVCNAAASMTSSDQMPVLQQTRERSLETAIDHNGFPGCELLECLQVVEHRQRWRKDFRV